MRYEYCPKCGRELVFKRAGDDGDVPYCESCKKYWFDSFSDCVIILVANEDKEMAMIKQHYLSDEYWSYVAGYIVPGETTEEAARREVKEELGLDLERLEYGGTYWFGTADQLMHGFVGFAKKKELVPSRELSAAEWVPFEEAPGRMFPPVPGNSQQPLYMKYRELIGEPLP